MTSTSLITTEPAQTSPPTSGTVSEATIVLPPISEVAPLVITDLNSRAIKGSMLELLSKAEGGAVFLAQASELAQKTSLTNLKPLLDHGQQARDAIAAVSKQMIGDSNLGEIGPVGTLFSSLSDVCQKVDISKISAPQANWQQWLASLPGIGKYFQPLYQVMERYKKVKPIIEEHEKSLAKLEADRVKSKSLYESLKEAEINGFRTLEVSIAAGELVLDREVKAFNERRAKINHDDIAALAQLKSMRDQLTNLDNRLMRLQGARADAILDFPIIDKAIDNEESLRSTLEDLRVITIPQIQKGVGMAATIHKQRKAAAFSIGTDELNASLREATIDGLGAAQQETHKAATKAANDVDNIIVVFTKMATVVKEGNLLVQENARINANARKQLQLAERTLKDAVIETLQDVAETAA